MKKLILTFIAAVATLSMQAQNINPEGDHSQVNNEVPGSCSGNCLSGWVIDFNLMAGALNQGYTANSPVADYTNPLNTTAGSLQFKQGMSYGAEVQGGYFFGKKRHWGVGLGLMYMYQQGNLTIDNFHTEYQSTDAFGNAFRQEITSDGQVKETLGISSFNVPVVAKFQTQFTKKVGFTADAGLLFNLHVQNYYNAKSSFDYEAVYKYVNTDGAVTTVYDNSPTPGASDLLITKSQYLANNSSASIQNYFNTLRNEGYNVGLGVSPNNNKGSVTYMSGSLGFLFRPAISIYLCHNANLNLGLYYYFQSFNNTASSNYHLTDKVGDYSSLMNTVTNATNNSYGVTAGFRYTFCKKEKPETPEVAEAPVVPEVETPVPTPPAAEPEEQENDHVDISTPLLFDLNKVVIKESSIPILEEAVKELKANPKAKLTINGYTDNTGTAEYNKKLSKRRATVVKNYLKKKGVNPKILKTVAHGENHPAASNKTREGRMRNRRVIMHKDDE